jgi:hypothetical protein
MEANTPALARQRKPRLKPARYISLRVKPADGSTGVVRIRVGTEQADYFLAEFAADFGRAFLVEKIGLEVKDGPYHVNIDGDKRLCTCKGFAKYNYCRHADGLAALVAAGRL